MLRSAKACIFLYVHIVCQNTKRRACAHTTHIDFVLFQYVKKGHNKHLDLFTKEDGWNILWHSGGLLLLKMEGKIMKRRITTVIMAILAFTLLMPFVSPAAYAADLLESKAVYYTEESDYIDGDCILTATRMMIRRAAIMILVTLSRPFLSPMEQMRNPAATMNRVARMRPAGSLSMS